jgi:hypothetical protein
MTVLSVIDAAGRGHSLTVGASFWYGARHAAGTFVTFTLTAVFAGSPLAPGSCRLAVTALDADGIASGRSLRP